MTIERPATGATVTSVWGQSVADAINGTPWTALPFSPPWTNFGTTYQVGQYRKVGDMVQVRGTVKGPGVVSIPSQIAVLPVGFRPPAYLQIPQESNGAYSYVQIDTAGNIYLMSPIGAVTAMNITFSFSVTP